MITNKFIACPHCRRQFKNTKYAQKEIQHHLYMGHKVDLVQSHEEAKMITEQKDNNLSKDARSL